MYTYSLLLNAIGTVDTTFFLVCLFIILAAVAVYFLMPLFRKSQYKERRESLRQREAAFKKSRSVGTMPDNGADSANADMNEAAADMPTSKACEVSNTEESL